MKKWIGRPILVLALMGATVGAATVASASVGTTPSTTTVVSSSSPAVVGQPVAFTATVTSGLATPPQPTGTVAFTDNGAPIACTATLIGFTSDSSTAVCTTTYKAPETSDSIAATYLGDGTYAESVGTTSETVNKASTTLGLAEQTLPAGQPETGQSVTFTATLAVTAPGAGTPTGSVTFTSTSPSSATLCSSVPLNGLTATCSVTTGLATSPGNIQASYSGDANFGVSSSSLLTVPSASAASTLVLISPSVNPASTGQTVTFRASVSATSPGGGTPPGTVTFSVTTFNPSNTPTVLAVCTNPVTLNAGTATCTVPGSDLFAATTPTVKVSASYSGSATPAYNASNDTSTPFVETVAEGVTDNVLIVTPRRVPLGGPVNLTVVVVPNLPAAGSPTGQVSFSVTALSGRSVVGFLNCSNSTNVETLSSDTATCSLPSLPPSANKLRVNATYFGDGNFLGASASKRIKLH